MSMRFTTLLVTWGFEVPNFNTDSWNYLDWKEP